MSLINHFSQQIQRYYPQQKQFLIGLSGGLDSTALLLLFALYRQQHPEIQLRAIHIHHNLSAHADDWASHCEQLCQQLAIPFLLEKVAVDKNKNIEASARDARYQGIKQNILSDEILVTAHHLQDQSETFLLALKRGSGLQGLSAMQIVSEMDGLNIFRPLLLCSRPQLENFVIQHQLPWVEDESNQDSRFERNFLRNEILPHLRQRWPHIDQAIFRSSQLCLAQQQLIDELLQESFSQYFDPNNQSFAIDHFNQFSEAKQNALLRAWLKQLKQAMPSQLQLKQIIQDVVFAKEDRLPEFKLNGMVIRRYQDRLYLMPEFQDLKHTQIALKLNQKILLPDNLGTLELTENQHHFIISWLSPLSPLALEPTELKTLTLDKTNENIQVRFSYQGKVKLKNGQHESLKKCWQKAHIPPWQRQRIPLIFYGENFKGAVGCFKNFA